MSINMQEPVVSVIVPIYKTQDYLEKCLASISHQSLSRIEIICVDDKSPDNSVAIAGRFAEEDSRFRLLRHKENLGLGGARNSGIRVARADYIATVDSDDYLDENFLRTLYEAATIENKPVDMVACGFRRVTSDGTELSQHVPKPQLTLNNNNYIDIFRHVNPGSCNKLWRKSLFFKNDIWFPNHTFNEDLATTPRLLACSKIAKRISDINYNYLMRDDSITHTSSDKHLIDYFRVFSILKDFLLERDLYRRYEKEFLRELNLAIEYHSENVRGDNKERERYLRQLLLIKWAFADYYDLVRLMPEKELETHLKRTAKTSPLSRENAKLIEWLYVLRGPARNRECWKKEPRLQKVYEDVSELPYIGHLAKTLNNFRKLALRQVG